jgi:hypothetical protein
MFLLRVRAKPHGYIHSQYAHGSFALAAAYSIFPSSMYCNTLRAMNRGGTPSTIDLITASRSSFSESVLITSHFHQRLFSVSVQSHLPVQPSTPRARLYQYQKMSLLVIETNRRQDICLQNFELLLNQFLLSICFPSYATVSKKCTPSPLIFVTVRPLIG